MKKILITLATIISGVAILLGMDLERFAFKNVDAGGHQLRMLISGENSPQPVARIEPLNLEKPTTSVSLAPIGGE